MDAGLAAVIAGAAGAGGAALAAFGTSLGLLRQAKLQGDQAHQSWLRDHRQQAFEDFLATAEKIQALCRDAEEVLLESNREHLSNEENQHINHLFDEIFAENRAVTTAVQRVTLLSDSETSDLALSLVQSMITFVQIANDARVGPALSDPSLEARLEAAQDAINDMQARLVIRARDSLQQA
ncbi:hypothetical protein ABMX48_31605 [Streptomyces cavourensis]